MFGLFRKQDPNKMKNDKVRKALAAHGDDGTRPRHVIHFAFPNEAGKTNETVVRDYLVAQGLEVDPAKMKEGLMGEETREVASEDFDDRTAKLAHAVAQWNWRYDGWECAVETGQG